MENRLNLLLLTSINEISGDTEKDTGLLREMAEEAKRFLLAFPWCRAIQNGWFGRGIGGIFAVFLFKIEPTDATVDKLLWVIVGDLPPAYLVIDEIPTPIEALKTYVELMQEWITAIREAKSIDNCIPVNSKPSRENADALEERLKFLKKEFLTN